MDPAERVVALIRKRRPDWQAGRWNGIGGHREGFELPLDAMVREFEEETSVKTYREQWRKVGVMREVNAWNCHVYTTREAPLNLIQSSTNEVVALHRIEALHELDCMANIQALVHLCRIKPDTPKNTIPQFELVYK